MTSSDTRQFLHGLGEISAFLECSRKRVRSLVRCGAPIRVTGRGDGRRYMAERAALRSYMQAAKRT